MTMTRRDICKVCCENNWVADDDPNCIVCHGSMHSRCAAINSSLVSFEEIKQWLINTEQYDQYYHACYDDDDSDYVGYNYLDFCPDCYEQYKKSIYCITCLTEENIEFCKKCKEPVCNKCSCFNCKLKLPEFRKYLCDSFKVNKLTDIIKKFESL